MSLPMRERELKLHITIQSCQSTTVAPHAGARIETLGAGYPSPAPEVAPHAGARIETTRTTVTTEAGKGRSPCGSAN